MRYSRVIQLVAVTVGLAYSLGYFSPRLRYTIEDQLPFVGIIALFLIGACVGLYAACLFAPSSFLATSEGRKWMSGICGVSSRRVFRSVCSVALLFFLSATYAILHFAFVFMRD